MASSRINSIGVSRVYKKTDGRRRIIRAETRAGGGRGMSMSRYAVLPGATLWPLVAQRNGERRAWRFTRLSLLSLYLA